MNPQSLVTGDFTNGPKLPYKLSRFIIRLVHHKWRFYFLVVGVLGISCLAFLGYKTPWRSSQLADNPEDFGQINLDDLINASDPNEESQQSSEQPDDQAEQTAGGSNAGNSSGLGPNESPPGGTPSGGSSSNGNYSPSSGVTCSPGTTGAGGYALPNLNGFPNACTTGPRYAYTTTSGSMTTMQDGQVIERMLINGSLDIRHNNVTVRDVTIMGTGIYSLDIGQNTTPCPANLRVEYVEVNMANAGNNELPIYQRCAGGHVFDHIKVHNCGRGMQLIGSVTVTNSYIYCHRTDPDSHRTALSSHGGSNFTVSGNTFICAGINCSSSTNMYSDYAPITNYLYQNNLLAGGSICLRAGETHTYAADTSNIRILNNRFSTIYNPECGQFQAIAQFDEDNPGNVATGNVYHESSAAIPGYY